MTMSDQVSEDGTALNPERELVIREFVRQRLDRSPHAGVQETLYQWSQAHQGEPVPPEDAQLIRSIFEQERAAYSHDGSSAVWVGAGIALLLHLLQIPLVFAAGYLSCAAGNQGGYCSLAGLVPIMFFGVSQLLYLGPAALIAHFTNHASVTKGILLTAAVGFLLNASCYGLVLGASMLHV
jgi:hypothetical protein